MRDGSKGRTEGHLPIDFSRKNDFVGDWALTGIKVFQGALGWWN
jgi:hypothetical protein